jgi:hypothetical protein
MSTTSELVERLRALIYRDVPWSHSNAVTTMCEAAEKIDELERENARLRELLSETMMDIAIYEDIGIIRARAMERRAALAGSGEK